MKKLHKYRSVFWLLPLLIFCCTCFSGKYASGELFLVSALMLPFSVWIAIVSSFRRNDFLFYPSVIFLSLLQFWPLFSYSAWRVMVLLFAAMLVLCVILCGRVWLILHSIIFVAVRSLADFNILYLPAIRNGIRRTAESVAGSGHVDHSICSDRRHSCPICDPEHIGSPGAGSSRESGLK